MGRVSCHLAIPRPVITVGCMKLALTKTKESCVGDIMPDYQFDVYRMMRAHNQNNWEQYNALTNVIVRNIR